MDTELRREVRFLTTRLGAMVREQAGPDAFERVETIRKLARAVRLRHDPQDVDALHRRVSTLRLAAAYDVAHAFSLFFQVVNLCEERARVRRLAASRAPAMSIARTLRDLKGGGVPAGDVQRCLDALEIEPVLTAHPTEPKRRSTMNHLRRLAARFDDPDEVLEALWQTEEVREHRIAPLDEVRNTLFFFESTIFEAAERLHRTLEAELASTYPKVRLTRPVIRFASWVGGDRDGHPLVTPEVTLTTARLQRDQVRALYHRELDALVEELSHAARGPARRRRHPPAPPPFHPAEVYRAAILDVRRKLDAGYPSASALVADLDALRDGLKAQGARRAAEGRLAALTTRARIFGLHLAELDVRDHQDRLREQPEGIVEELAVVRRLQREGGEAAAHRFILSMTREAGDLLLVLDLARRARVSALDVVPLFETLSDLERAPRVLDELLATPSYRRHLRRRGDVQEVMLGYSDSNKDGGYLAANVFLDRAQRRLAAVADAHRIGLRLFHGKGGTIDRGGGMSHRSLLAQPHASHGGRLRITEQGEVVSLKYGDPAIAERNLEQLVSAVIGARCLARRGGAPAAPRPEWEACLDTLARISRDVYRRLVHEHPGMESFFWEATPIDLVEHLRIGSRPSRRKASRAITALRAIPWVLAWTQSRFMLSAWYGMGGALLAAADGERGGMDRLRAMYRGWPFFALLIDNAEVSLAKTDLFIARRYAGLVRETRTRRDVLARIEEEHERTVRMVLAVSGRKRLLESQPVLAESIRLRNPYVDPLNHIQIRFLSRWRAAGSREPPPELRRLLALTVNGIAFGMKSTG